MGQKKSRWLEPENNINKGPEVRSFHTGSAGSVEQRLLCVGEDETCRAGRFRLLGALDGTVINLNKLGSKLCI